MTALEHMYSASMAIHDGVPSTLLPLRHEVWPLPSRAMRGRAHADPEDVSWEEVRKQLRGKPCIWPDHRILFFCDLHADTDAFLLSLEASGGIQRTGSRDGDMTLTPLGTDALFVIGGDCFDKGPENLRLLRCIQALMGIGAKVVLLAGNHDLRTYLGLAYAGRREPRFQHLFVRMGRKTLPLFREILDELRSSGGISRDRPTESEVRRQLFPDENWYQEFRSAVRGSISPPKVEKELVRIREKCADLDRTARELGMTLGDLYIALSEAQRMFIHAGGELHWYFERMVLAYRAGSFLFVHAGVDDRVAQTLAEHGLSTLNEQYRRLMEEDLFELYHGSIGNAFRTKYRDLDYPLTDRGRRHLERAGIYAIVHGHRNILRGQRLTLRAGVLNFECDASVDRATRKLEGLRGPGGAALRFEPAGRMYAVSTDYPFVKEFDPSRVFPLTVIK